MSSTIKTSHTFACAVTYTEERITGAGRIAVHAASPQWQARIEHDFAGIGGAFDVVEIVREYFDLQPEERQALTRSVLTAVQTAQRALCATYGRD